MCEIVLSVNIAEIDRFELSVTCFNNFPDFDLVSAVTSTNADDKERITASQREQINEVDNTNRNETKIKII